MSIPSLARPFPRPRHPVMDQKGLLFQPHILAMQVGTTVDFLNSDKVAHNVFWPSIMQGGKKLPGKTSEPGRRARSALQIRSGGRSLAAVQRASGDGWLYRRLARRPTSRKQTRAANTKSTTFPTANTAWSRGMKARRTPPSLSPWLETPRPIYSKQVRARRVGEAGECRFPPPALSTHPREMERSHAEAFPE